jgi:tagatose 1,6-diphosphate aldolase
MLAACRDPLTARLAPAMATTTREQIMGFLKSCPRGHQQPRAGFGSWPTYHFWMRLRNRGFWNRASRAREIPYEIAGGIGLRIGRSRDLECYTGHVGYHVYPAARGHRYAERACRLLLPLARRHGFDVLWITCNPDNAPSRITCERLGATMIEVVDLPEDHTLYRQGERLKCRYRLQL